jgi:RNA polymerase sigma-B factor
MAVGRFPLIVRWGTPPASGGGPPANQMVRVMSEPGASPEGTATDLDDVGILDRSAEGDPHGDADAERARRTRAAVEVLRACLLDRETSGTPSSDPGERERWARQELVLANEPIARAIAYRYRNRGEPTEELLQTARLGLVKAANGYVPDRGVDFLAYAVPTMTGEVKRYFRDQGWAVRPPRRLQELGMRMNRVRAELEHELGRSPTVPELARALGVDPEDVIEALASAQSYQSVSLDAPSPSAGPEADVSLADTLGGDDDHYALVEDIASLKPLLARLPARERRILAMRFFDELTQQHIGERVGVTQMQVSRLINRSLTRLREELAKAS